jgi:type IV pilus assembly protein PilB
MEELVKKGALGTILCTSGIITEQDITLALEEQQRSGCRFGESLVRLGIVQQEDIDWALSNQLDIPYVRLSEQNIDRAALALVPVELARHYNLIPIIRTGDELHIALADPLNTDAVKAVEQASGCRVTVSMPIIRELREMLDLFYGPEEDAFSFGFTSPSFTGTILEKINADRSGARLLEYLILFFLQNGISTLALQPIGGRVRVSGRHGRQFREIGRFPLSSYAELSTHIRKIIRLVGSRESALQGDFTFRHQETEVLFRVATIRAKAGDCITIRRQPEHSFPGSLDELHLEPGKAAALHALAASGGGLVLMPSWDKNERCRFLDLFLNGSDTTGKNVLLLGNALGTGKRSFPLLPLSETTPEAVATLLGTLADHDPDTIVMDDATDSRIFATAWQFALRGTLVLAGIARGGLGGALDYLIHERQANRSLAAGIRGIVAITGVRTLCPACKIIAPVSTALQKAPAEISYQAPGCAACQYSGFGETRHLVDVVSFYQAFQDRFATARDGSEMLGYLAGTGYRTVAGELLELLQNGEISVDEYMAALTR